MNGRRLRVGITIHFRFEFKGAKKELAEKLTTLRQRFMDLPVEAVNKVIDIPHADIVYGYGKYKGQRYHECVLGFMMLQHYYKKSLHDKRVEKLIDKVCGLLLSFA
jgi:hypothetical protein